MVARTRTFGNQVDRIADELGRSDLNSQIELEYKSAISFYESYRNWNNEAQLSVSFTTSSSTEFITLPALRPLIRLDTLNLTDTATEYDLLERRPHAWMEYVQDGSTYGEPEYYAIYGDQIRLYPIPSAAYVLTASGIFEDSSTLTATTCSTFWTSGLPADLIRARAKAAVQINYLGHQGAVQEMIMLATGRMPQLSAMELTYFKMLKKRENARASTGFVEPENLNKEYTVGLGFTHPERL